MAVFDKTTLSHMRLSSVTYPRFHFHTVLAFTQALTKHTHATLSPKGRAPKCPPPPRRRRRVQHRISRGTNNSRTATAAAGAAAAATEEAGMANVRHRKSIKVENVLQ